SSDAVGCDCSRCPGFIDRLQCVALQASMTHCFFRVAFRSLDATPAVLSAPENIPRDDDLAGDVVTLADKRIGVDAMRRASFKRNAWNKSARGGTKRLLCRFLVGFRREKRGILPQRDGERFVL